MKERVLCLQSDMHYCYWITCISCMHTLQAVPGYHPKGVYVEGEQCKQKYRGCTYVERYVGMIIEKWAEWENETLKGERASVLLNSFLLVDWQVFWISCGTVSGNSMDEWSLWEDPWRLPGWDSRHTVKKELKLRGHYQAHEQLQIIILFDASWEYCSEFTLTYALVPWGYGWGLVLWISGCEGSWQCLVALSCLKSHWLTSSTHINFKNRLSHCLAVFKLVDLPIFFPKSFFIL